MVVDLATRHESRGCVRPTDNLSQMAGVSFHAYGLSVGVRTNRPDVLPRILERLPPSWQLSQAPFGDHLLTLRVAAEESGLLDRDGTVLARSPRWEDLLEALESEVQIRVAEHAPEYVFVHAGVVAWRGRALLLPGRSGSGKSTLVAALLCAGATYYSDEYAVLDRQGWVYPYPRRLALRGPEGTVYRRGPEAFGSYAGSEPLPVGLVAALHYHPDRRWRARLLRAGQAVLELFAHTVPARSRPDDSLAVLRRLARNCLTVRGTRGQAGETAPLLLHLLGGGICFEDPSAIRRKGEQL